MSAPFDPKAPSPVAPPTSGIACTLTADQLAAQRQELIPGLFDRATEVTDLPDGLRFRFDAAPSLLRYLTGVIEREQACCSFLRFALTAEPHGGPVTLEVTGPSGTGEMLRTLVPPVTQECEGTVTKS